MPYPKDKKGLTVKQKKFVKEYVANDGNGTKAALAVYDTVDEKTAGVIAVENLGKPSIKEAIDQALEKHGITIEKATKPIADGLVAMKYFGGAEDGYEVIDHTSRLKASAMALKLMGADQKDDTGKTINFNFNGNTTNKFNAGDFKE